MTTRQYRIDRHACPLCYGGELWEKCDACGGIGEIPARQADSAALTTTRCTVCGGAGEVVTRKCDLCSKGFVTAALMRLAEAEKHVRGQEPNWSGDNRDHDGITVYSMAEWFRRRGDLLDVRAAAGFFEDDEARVILTGRSRATVAAGRRDYGDVTFTGFAWGYGGEGPNGLAAVLADAGFFASLDEALGWIARQDFGQPWELSR